MRTPATRFEDLVVRPKARHIVIWFALFFSILPVAGRDFHFFEPLQPPRPFQMMVHRGLMRTAPENTRPALERCIEDGIEWVEVDIRRTRDGKHILAHNDVIVAADGKQWKIVQSNYSDLQTLDLGSAFAPRYRNERLLTIEECFQLAKNRINLYLDCKDADPEQLAAEVLAHQMEAQVVLYQDPEWLGRLHQAAHGRIAGMTKWRPGTDPAQWAAKYGFAAVEIDAPDLTKMVVQAFHQAGVKVQTKNLGEWDQPQWWDQVIDAGADWMQTDLPEELYAHALWRRIASRPCQFSLHRGAGRYAPENTLPALEKALRLQADFVEIDVRTSRDGQFYLLHDSRLDRTTNGRGLIAETTAEVLSRLDAGAWFGRPFVGTTLPSFEGFLSHLGPTARIYLDAKEISAKALVAALERHGAVEKTVVYGSPDYLIQLKDLQPNLRRMPALRSEQDITSLVERVRPFALDAAWEILSKPLIDRCHAAGVKVFSDSLGRHERIPDYLQAMEWGIDLIQTDHPLRLFRAMELWAHGKTP